MRLTVQSFQRKFDENDPNIKQKLDDYTKTLLQQIDIMSSVANAFSNFASMPAQQNERINVVEVVSLGLEIFNENYIHLESTKKEIFMLMDRTQLIRIITNLVKNATQAITDENQNPSVVISVSEENSIVKIEVKDNGIGISDENKMYVFEPKFTTKNSGMGLGLGIIKKIIENYNGTITFESEQNKGTTFTVLLPINTNK
jgi:signal transduction histidine kinase